jgi:hypothetical protein
METKVNEPRERYDRLVRAAQRLPPVTTAVAHPCDRISIEGVVEAARLGLIAPILVGPLSRVHDAARQTEAARNRHTATIPLQRRSSSSDKGRPRP